MDTRPAGNHPVRELSTNECWDRLRSMAVGRLAVCGPDYPEVFPINYAADHGTLLFRSDPGTKVAASLAGARVAFEVDGFDGGTRQAWSVVVKGGLETVLQTVDVIDALAVPLFPWQDGSKAFFIRIIPVALTGRQFTVVDPQRWVSHILGVRPAPEE